MSGPYNAVGNAEGIFAEGDVAELVCPSCGLPVHITEFGPGGVPIEEHPASIEAFVLAHIAVFHPVRAWLIRRFTFGWLP